jgi:hypothetical protein
MTFGCIFPINDSKIPARPQLRLASLFSRLILAHLAHRASAGPTGTISRYEEEETHRCACDVFAGPMVQFGNPTLVRLRTQFLHFQHSSNGS